MAKQPFSRNADEHVHADIGWLSRQGFAHLGYAYREAAEVLCEAPAVSGRSEEAMYLVASFAFRQSIELYLKSIIQLVEMHRDTRFPSKKHTHQLLSIWDWIDSKLSELGHPPLPADARSVAADFERVDPNGTAFRYNVDLKGSPQLAQLPPAVSLTNLKSAAADVIHLLDSFEEYLGAKLNGTR
jgi:hypothetical protein